MAADASFAAVLTGDLVGSSRAAPDQLDRTMAALEAGFAAMAPWLEGPARFTRYRGDGWQALIRPAPLGLRAALLILARLRRDPDLLDSRMALGHGPVQAPGTGDLDAAGGPAFQQAGHALDRMARRRRLTCAAEQAPDAQGPLVALLDLHSARWSPAQAQALVFALAPTSPTQAAIAAELGVSQQGVQDHLSLSGLWAIEEALAWWEENTSPEACNHEYKSMSL